MQCVWANKYELLSTQVLIISFIIAIRAFVAASTIFMGITDT